VHGHDVLFGYPMGGDSAVDLRRDRWNSAPYLPKCDEHRRWYVNYTGCSNTLNTSYPRVLQLLMGDEHETCKIRSLNFSPFVGDQSDQNT
jgi:hypothetical protein